MPQNTITPDYPSRIAKLQAAMKEFGLQAIVLEPGPAMLYLTGVRWGKSERTFAVVLPAKGDPVWVLPAFEEMRARELIHVGTDNAARFFVFDGIRKLSPKLVEYVGAAQVLKTAGVDMTAPAGRGSRN